jgi:VCBS repeat-containing protein
MTDHPTAPPSAADDGLEGRLRTLLLERAETVTGPPPALPDPHRDAGPLQPVALAEHRRRRWLPAAAAAAVVVAAAGLLVAIRAHDPAGQDVHTTQPPSPTAGLPADFDPTTAEPVMRINGDRDPEVAARRYLRWRLAEPGMSADDAVADLRFDAGERDGAIVPVQWRRGDGTLGGTVIVRVGERGSDIVASTAPGVDLGAVHMDGDRAVGHVVTSDPTLPGPALVDVLFAGNAFPVPVDGAMPAPPVRGYGSAARGEAPFDVTVGGYDPIVSARFVEDGAVRTIAELALRAPHAPGPDLSTMTGEELFDHLEQQTAPDPRCVVTGDIPIPPAVGDRTTSSEPTDAPVFDLPLASSPLGAVEAFAGSLGLDATDITLTSPLSSGGVAGAWLGDAAVGVQVREHDGGFEAVEVATAAACWNAGSGPGSAGGAPTQTHLDFSRIPDGRTGQIWYRTDDGATSTATLDAGDVARGNVVIDGEDRTVEAMAVVIRGADGKVVLVQRVLL